MSHELYFTIIPFDPMIIPNIPVPLPFELDDFTQQLQDQCPSGRMLTHGSGEDIVIRLYISIEQEEYWNVVNFYLWENTPIIQISGFPKRLAKELVFWYRQYMPIRLPLFLIIPEDDFMVELTAQTSLDDIEKMYPYPVSEA